MYERMQQIVGNELKELPGYASYVCRRFRMPSDGEDVLQDVFKSMCQGGQRNQGFAKTVCKMPPEELRAYLKKAIRNAVRRLREKSDAEARKRQAWVEAQAVWGRTGPSGVGMADPEDKEKALRVVRRVNAELDAQGRFALTVILSGKSPEYVAGDFGVSERTGRRWHRVGIALLRKAIDRVLGDEFGDQAADEFARLAAIYQATKEKAGSDNHT